jgi:hypothetical protein
MILPISASQIARITGVSCQRPLWINLTDIYICISCDNIQNCGIENAECMCLQMLVEIEMVSKRLGKADYDMEKIKTGVLHYTI